MTAFLVDPATGFSALVYLGAFVCWQLFGVLTSLPLPRAHEQRQREGEFLVRHYRAAQERRRG